MANVSGKLNNIIKIIQGRYYSHYLRSVLRISPKRVNTKLGGDNVVVER